MNTKQLLEALDVKANALREKHYAAIDTVPAEQQADDADTLELVLVLIRIVRGTPLARAFGAPGDWGYSTLIGKALAARPDTEAIGEVNQQ